MKHCLQVLAFLTAVGVAGGVPAQIEEVRTCEAKANAAPPPGPIDPEVPACCQSGKCKC